MDRQIRGHLLSMAVLLIGTAGSALLFFLHWALGASHAWVFWMMPLSYAVLLGSALIAVLVQLYVRYRLPRRRVIGITLIIVWVALSLLSTVLDTLGSLSLPGDIALRASGIITICGGVLLVIPGFVLILLPLRRDPPS
jgi:hypothetical protein